MNPLTEHRSLQTRRHFFGRSATGLGSLALGSLLNPRLLADDQEGAGAHVPAKAKRIIYLFQSGGPAQMDLFDYKPELRERFGQEVPKSVYPDDRKTTMSSAQKSFATAPSSLDFHRRGKAGIWRGHVVTSAKLGEPANTVDVFLETASPGSSAWQNATLGAAPPCRSAPTFD